MAIDDRKQRILTEIVALYAMGGEPVGSGLLSRQFNMAVSSATLRNEMAALTRLGLLEQPHTSAGRVPTAKGYRYYVDNLLRTSTALPDRDKQALEAVFSELDSDPDKLAQTAARALADYLGVAVIATTPRSDDLCVAHFEVLQVGRYSAVVLAVTSAGGVRTRVAKVDFELDEDDVKLLGATLNHFLRFVAEPDVTQDLLRDMVQSLDVYGNRYAPVLASALTLLSEIGRPNVYFEGEQHLLHWPELENSLRAILEFATSPGVEAKVGPRDMNSGVLFGEELEPAIPGLCVVSHRYLAGGGLSGVIAVVGPSRMRFGEVLPRLQYFARLLGGGMAGG